MGQSEREDTLAVSACNNIANELSFIEMPFSVDNGPATTPAGRRGTLAGSSSLHEFPVRSCF